MSTSLPADIHNDVICGFGIVRYAHFQPEKVVNEKVVRPSMPSGWVLPGGERTQNKMRAAFAAEFIHRQFIKVNKTPVKFSNPHNTTSSSEG